MKKIIRNIFDFFQILYNYMQASIILRENFISPKDISSLCGIFYTKEQMKQLGKTIPKRSILKQCRNNNSFLVAGPDRPMSLLEIRNLINGYFCTKEGGWYARQDQKFSQNDKVESKWYIIRKDIVHLSTSKNWDDQYALISGTEFVPNAPELVWAIMIYKAKRGIYLFGEFNIRTSSLNSDGDHVFICILSNLDNTGLSINCYKDRLRASYLGLSVAMEYS